LWVPCLWLETSPDSDSVRACWHISEAAGKLAVPKYFRQESNLAQYCQLMKWRSASGWGKSAGTGHGLYRDRKSRAIVFGPSPLCRH